MRADLVVDGLSREEARHRVVGVSQSNRGRSYVVEQLPHENRIVLRMDGKKTSLVDGRKEIGLDFTIHIDSFNRRPNYIDDYFVDLIEKRVVQPQVIPPILKGIELSIHLIPYEEVLEEITALVPGGDEQLQGLPGHGVELLLKLAKWLGVQEDVNYWGRKVGKGKGRYEGREKPIKALTDYFVKEHSLKTVLKKHFMLA